MKKLSGFNAFLSLAKGENVVELDVYKFSAINKIFDCEKGFKHSFAAPFPV